MFTGDKSGEFLYSALYRASFANQAEGRTPNDGLILVDTYITNVVHCAPPGNKPTTLELDNCRSYLVTEIEILPDLQVILALGKLAFDSILIALRECSRTAKIQPPNSRPYFIHGAQYTIEPYILLACYHPSQRNTNTGLLTIPMIDTVLQLVRRQLTE
jgi:uracil-DNA glycosylase family 4